MKKTGILILAIALITMSFTNPIKSIKSTLDVDVTNSTITWKGYKPTGSHTGTIMLQSGTLEMDGENLIGGTFTVDMTSIKDSEGNIYELTPNADFTLDAATINVAAIDADPSNNKNLYLGSGVPFWANIEGNGIIPFRNDIPFAFKGQMDDFRMFSVALTAQEVTDLYNAEKP